MLFLPKVNPRPRHRRNSGEPTGLTWHDHGDTQYGAVSDLAWTDIKGVHPGVAIASSVWSEPSGTLPRYTLSVVVAFDRPPSHQDAYKMAVLLSSKGFAATQDRAMNEIVGRGLRSIHSSIRPGGAMFKLPEEASNPSRFRSVADAKEFVDDIVHVIRAAVWH